MPSMLNQNALPPSEPLPPGKNTSPQRPSQPGVAAARPLWARFLGKLLEPWIALKIEPESPAQHVDERPICYVLEDYGISNALILERACREAGLPSPLKPLHGDLLGRKRAYVALSRRHVSALGITPCQ